MMSNEFNYLLQDSHEHRTIQQTVVQVLHDAITQGYLVPGQKLVYSEIADQLNVSVTPVREAVKTLEAMGMVTIRPRRTAFVSYLTAEQLEQLYVLRTLLEGMATRYAVDRISPQELAHLNQVYEELDRVIGVLNGDTNEVARSEGIVSLRRLHDEFHISLYAPCGNQYLLQMIDLLRGQVAIYWPVVNRYDIARVNRSHLQHSEILDACRQKKPGLASRLLREHLQETVPWIVDHIRANHPRGSGGSDRGKVKTGILVDPGLTE
ncbi:GntR family transcriptional regulator [Chloroflexota bacterium]